MNNFIPNTTQVPNIIFDKIMTHLTGSELKVLLFFIRQRYGFQKFTGQFSYAIKQICEGIKKNDGTIICHGTGLSNRQVLNSLKTLKEKYHLIKMKHGDFQNKICNKYELCIGEKSSPTLSEKSSPTLSEKSSPTSVKKVHYQETNKKQIETNNSNFIKLHERLLKDYYIISISTKKEYIIFNQGLSKYRAAGMKDDRIEYLMKQWFRKKLGAWCGYALKNFWNDVAKIQAAVK